jgi:hypothetical protein
MYECCMVTDNRFTERYCSVMSFMQERVQSGLSVLGRGAVVGPLEEDSSIHRFLYPALHLPTSAVALFCRRYASLRVVSATEKWMVSRKVLGRKGTWHFYKTEKSRILWRDWVNPWDLSSPPYSRRAIQHFIPPSPQYKSDGIRCKMAPW